jgi:hypothetical protein
MFNSEAVAWSYEQQAHDTKAHFMVTVQEFSGVILKGDHNIY